MRNLELKFRKLLYLMFPPRISFCRDNPWLVDFDIGAWSYGRPKVRRWSEGTTLRMGKYCSIAGDVKIFLGGEHRADWVTTYPFPAVFAGVSSDENHVTSRGDVIVGNDVWIGDGATILSGVHIGDGAVVGAGAVVAQDVPPYAVVVGNPARVVKYRFTEDQIAGLLRITWWDWPDDEVQKNVGCLMTCEVDRFIERFDVTTKAGGH